jgi:hypothetical protein
MAGANSSLATVRIEASICSQKESGLRRSTRKRKLGEPQVFYGLMTAHAQASHDCDAIKFTQPNIGVDY